MLSMPTELARLYDAALISNDIAIDMRGHYKKWLRYYWDFFHKYGFKPDDRQSFAAFNDKLQAKNQPSAPLEPIIGNPSPRRLAKIPVPNFEQLV